MICGVNRGYETLSPFARETVKDLTTSDVSCLRDPKAPLTAEESRDLELCVEKLGLRYHRIFNRKLGYLHDDGDDGADNADYLLKVFDKGCTAIRPHERDNFLWTVSWDGCLENKRTGRIIMLDENGDCVMAEWPGLANLTNAMKWTFNREGTVTSRTDGATLLLNESGFTRCSFEASGWEEYPRGPPAEFFPAGSRLTNPEAAESQLPVVDEYYYICSSSSEDEYEEEDDDDIEVVAVVKNGQEVNNASTSAGGGGVSVKAG